MNVIPSFRNVPTDSILTGMVAFTEFVSADPAADLVIEHLDEFAADSYSPTMCCGVDHIFAAAPVAA